MARISIKQVAERLGVSDDFIRRRIAEGKLKAYRCGRTTRIEEADADQLFKPTIGGAAR